MQEEKCRDDDNYEEAGDGVREGEAVQGDVRWVQDEAGPDGADDGDVARVEVQGASEEASAGATDAVSEMHGGGWVQEDGRKRKRREGGGTIEKEGSPETWWASSLKGISDIEIK